MTIAPVLIEELLLTSLAWTMALCAGLMTGIYAAFSGFIMRSFSTLDTACAIAAMNAINAVILKSLFIPLFFGSTFIALLMVIAGLWQWGEPTSNGLIAGGLIYVVGMFIVTVAGNVPLNNTLAKVKGDEEAARIWVHYLRRWTRWNTLRTIASLATLVICIEVLSR
ncbi:MAG: anthrone oxygenase family protein [Pseudomonadota bacterium]